MYDDMHHSVRAPKPWIRWILLIVVLTLVLVIGYGMGVNQSQIEKLESASSNAVIESETSDVTDTVNTSNDSMELAQTFTHPHGYRVKYPDGWHSKMGALETCFAPTADFEGGVQFLFCISIERVTVAQFIEIMEGAAVVGQKSIVINGVDATELVLSHGSVESTYFLIPGNGVMYVARPGLDVAIERSIIDSFQVIDPTGDLSEVK